MPPSPEELASAHEALRAHIDRLTRGFLRLGLMFGGLLALVSMLPFVNAAGAVGVGEALREGAGGELCSSLCWSLFAAGFVAAVARPAVRFRFRPLLREGVLGDAQVVQVQGWWDAPGGWFRLLMGVSQALFAAAGLPTVAFRVRYELDGTTHTVPAFAYADEGIEEGPVTILMAENSAWPVPRYSESRGTRSA